MKLLHSSLISFLLSVKHFFAACFQIKILIQLNLVAAVGALQIKVNKLIYNPTLKQKNSVEACLILADQDVL